MRVESQSKISTRGKPTIQRPLQPASSTRRELDQGAPQTAVLTPTLPSHNQTLSGPNSETSLQPYKGDIQAGLATGGLPYARNRPPD